MKTALCLGPLAIALVCCGGSVADTTGTPSADGGPDAATSFDGGAAPDVGVADAPVGPFVPAPHPDAPQVQSFGGKTIASPNVIPVFFSGDSTAQAQVESFLSQLSKSSYWTATTSEYGVGSMTIAKSIVTTDTAPATGDAMDTWLADMTDGTHAGWPKPDANTIYSIFLPTGATITIPQWGTSCKGFGGFHYEASGKQSESIVYTVMPRCASFGKLKGMDALTTSLSHELVEAVTDPRALSDPAYAIVDPDHFVWALAPLSEVGDMCAYEPQSDQQLLGTSWVQRTWSNAAATAGHDPCVPALSAPYFNSVPVLTSSVTLDFGGGSGQVQTKGIQIPVGQSKTIEVDLFSDAPTDSWTVQAQDTASISGGTPGLSFSWDKQSGNNGDKLQLTITRTKAGPYAGSEFMIWSQKGLSVGNLWFGFVGN